jgi:inosose dehydratase
MNSQPPVSLRHCLVGANPIIWSNDDFADLAGDVPLDTILADMRATGYSGTELGHAYPRSAAPLAAVLSQHEMRLASGWHSTFLATGDLTSELAGFQAHLNLLQTLGARVAIVAECSHCVHGNKEAPLGFTDSDRVRLTEAEWERVTSGMKHLSALAAARDIQVVYHHHMGTVIQSGEELDRLLGAVPELSLVLDPGHLTFAGLDPVAVARRHLARIGHVHLKSVRREVAARAKHERWSFYRAVSEGVFTIPGDGCVDFPALFALLAQADYRGWLIVEAEEHPHRVPARPKAITARAYVRQQTGA